MHNILICGAGNQGAFSDIPGNENSSKIISFAHACKHHKKTREMIFVDKSINKARKAAEIWGGIYCETIKKAFAQLHMPDIVVISTNDDSHYEILKELAECPLKLVIVEKPICNDLIQAREIVELYKAKGTPLMVNYTRRFLPYYEDLKQRYEAGEFGLLIGACVNFNRGFIHTGSHGVDLVNWLGNPEKLVINEIDNLDYRLWQMDLYFERYHWREERIGDMPVWDYCDKQTYHVMDNAYEFLEGREPLKCTGENGLAALEICCRMMNK
jgi:predicted dehydrogenase